MSSALPLAAALLSQTNTGDVSYLVRAGQVMAETGELLRVDVFTFTVGGESWLNQQWGSELVLAGSYGSGGWRGLVVLRALLTAFAVGVTYWRTRRAGADPFWSGLLSLVAFVVAVTLPGTFALRSQLLAVPLFLAASLVLDRWRDEPVRALGLAVIGVVWANVHGSFVLLPLLIALRLVDEVSEHRSRRWLAASLVASLVTPFATPWGAGTYRYVGDLATSPIVRDVIDEWRPLWEHAPAGPVFAVVVLALLVAVARQPRRLRPGQIASLVAFTGLAAWSGRNLLWWSLVVPPIAAMFAPQGGERREPSARATAVVAVALGSLVAVGLMRVVTITPEASLLADAPTGLAGALADATEPGDRVFASWSGGWYELVVPDVLQFTDARVELFPDEVWGEYFTVVNAEPGWQGVLDRWEVDVLVVDAERHEVLLAAAQSSPWSPAFQDGDGVVFERAE